jgi:glutamine cyclotransferase
MQESLMKKLHLVFIVLVAVTIAIVLATIILLKDETADTKIVNYTYEVIKVYPHDPNAFTQGLVMEEGVLYEGTGLYGSSTLRRVDLETGNVLETRVLSEGYFGEGITIFGNKIIQLTWKANKAFVYDKSSFDLIEEFSYPTEGWGITTDGTYLIMSDGSANLYFLDPETFETIRKVEVWDNQPVTRLNELEYIEGRVYANIWLTDKIAIIDPDSGLVTGWIDLKGIYATENSNSNDVLNGIAYDEQYNRLFVTGKRWTKLFQIEMTASE